MRLTTQKLTLLIPIIALALRMASSGTASVSYLLLASYALLGRKQAVQALALSWLFTLLSDGIAPIASGAIIGRYAVIFAAAGSVLLRRSNKKKTSSISWLLLATVALGVFFILHSLFVSPLPDVSILKAVSWTTVVATLLAAWSGLSFEERSQLEYQLFGGLIVLILVSLPLAFSGIGYLRNGTGFQGILNHPQAFGPTVAFLGGWLGGRLLGTAQPRWREIALLGLCLVLIVMSEARTAGLALVLGLIIASLTSSALSGIAMRRLMPGLRSSRLQILVLLAVVGSLLAGGILSERIGAYLTKRTDATNLLEAAEASRGGLVDLMVANIEKNPLTGIGFGIASDVDAMEVERDPILGLPTGAVIEKGVLPFAVMEELGVLGFVLVFSWIFLLARQGARSGMAALTVLIIVFLTNLGESTLFSPGGMGLLPLILLTWAISERRLPLRNRPYG